MLNPQGIDVGLNGNGPSAPGKGAGIEFRIIYFLSMKNTFVLPPRSGNLLQPNGNALGI